jgi:type II secretory pathway pseudopilin PulG
MYRQMKKTIGQIVQPMIGQRIKQKIRDKTQEAGLTIIESIMAILVLTVVLVAITPPLALIVATRVQNRRAEQAMHLAQSEVDHVRVLVELGDYTTEDLPGTNSAAPASVNDVEEKDIDKDGSTDFLVQSFITYIDQDTLDDIPVRFDLTVRVYAAVAADNYGSLKTEQASLKLTSGEGSQGTRPLAVVKTEVIRTDEGTVLNKLQGEDTEP